MSKTSTFANPNVLEFYKTLPFNYRESVEGSVRAVRETDQLIAYPVLKPLLQPGIRVLDVGCGAGWLSHAMAYRHGVSVTGIDFNPVAIARASEVAEAMRLHAQFIAADLFTYDPAEPFDLAVSIGVLHRTDNCHAAIQRVFTRFLKPGGHAFIGLYHTYGRLPLLEHFEEMKRKGATEDEMLARYTELHSQLKDKTHLRSWFRDQVLHPHETQHTLEEMMPLLDECGMELVTTSINRFEPIGSLAQLIAEERKYYDIGVERLRQNQYFTGFFVFLARRKDAVWRSATGGRPAPAAAGRRLDNRPYVEHHPIFGYRYTPGIDVELPKPGGGHYNFSVNSQGIRSCREYEFRKPQDIATRIIVCGDSMAAGQFVSTDQRFSELLERQNPGLEVLNLALEGSGTDQQLLLYEHIGLQYEHDLVILLPFLQNVRRNMVEAREGIDPNTGRKVLRPKPRYELTEGKLVLRNVPVPKEADLGVSGPRPMVNTAASSSDKLKTWLSSVPGVAAAKRLAFAVAPWEPFPEYRDPRSPEWRLMEAIVERFKDLSGSRPLVLVPTFYSNYVRYRMARNYWYRYASLEKRPGIYAVDILPHFKKLGRDGIRCFQEPHDMHFSAYGNLILADALQVELRALGLLPRAGQGRGLAAAQTMREQHG